MLISMKAARSLLPKVGDIRTELPTMFATPGKTDDLRKPLPCKVVLVNTAHLWYMVEFENGFRECYKVPKQKTDPKGRPQ